MAHCFVGIGQLSLLFRHARTLKDKRQVLRSVEQKMKNLGFSVAECDYQDNPKQSVLGYSFVGDGAGAVERALDQVEQFFIGHAEVLRAERDVFDYSEKKNEEFDQDFYNEKEDP